LACYGTLAIIGLFGALGFSVSIHKGAWAITISLFALIALLGAVLNYRKHGIPPPAILSTIGFGLILWAMFVHFQRFVEITGFSCLIIKAIWDHQIKKRIEVSSE
jgi:hypothetical protein